METAGETDDFLYVCVCVCFSFGIQPTQLSHYQFLAAAALPHGHTFTILEVVGAWCLSGEAVCDGCSYFASSALFEGFLSISINFFVEMSATLRRSQFEDMFFRCSIFG